jgi:hypothetical protein
MEAPLEEVGADDPDPDIIGRDLVCKIDVMLLSGVDRLCPRLVICGV